MSATNCPSCGQFRGRGHRCPGKTAPAARKRVKPFRLGQETSEDQVGLAYQRFVSERDADSGVEQVVFLTPQDVSPRATPGELAEIQAAEQTVAELERQLAPLVGRTFDKPSTGASGHAIGTPVEDMVANHLKEAYGDQGHLPHEMLNHILLANPEANTAEARRALLGNPARGRLLGRSDPTMAAVSVDNPIVASQNATADVCILNGPMDRFADCHLVMIDVKSRKPGQRSGSGNMISSEKLGEAMHAMRTHHVNKTNFDLMYAHLSLEDDPDDPTKFRVASVRAVDLFRIPPERLYINWVAGRQIQVDLTTIEQDYRGTRQEWAQAFLMHRLTSYETFLSSAVERRDMYRQMTVFDEEFLDD